MHLPHGVPVKPQSAASGAQPAIRSSLTRMLIALARTLARLPLGWFHRAGAVFGWLMYWSWPTYGSRMRDNLRASGICAGERHYHALLRLTIRETGKAVLETAKIWFGPDRDTIALVRDCQGWSHVDEAQRRGRGIIFITPHLGCFEIAAQYIAHRIPLTALYRPPRHEWLDQILVAGRKRTQLALAPTSRKGVQLLLRALRTGEAVGLLPDQAPNSRAGVWVNFFGRPAYTMSLVSKLQQSTGAAVITAFARRLPGAQGFRLEFEPVATEGFDESALSRVVEELVRRCPEQYLWSYNRHKVPRLAAEPPR